MPSHQQYGVFSLVAVVVGLYLRQSIHGCFCKLQPLSGAGPRVQQLRSRAGPLRAAEGRAAVPGPAASLIDGQRREAFPADVATESRRTPAVTPQFATLIYRERLRQDPEEIEWLNQELLLEAQRLRDSDTEGRRWSEHNYAGGYTSYGSQRSLNRFVPAAGELEGWLKTHLRAFTGQLQLLDVPDLFMTDCWVNIMGRGTEHVFHQHGSSTISGTYYVQTPTGCPGISFEDPRLDRIAALRRRSVVEYPVRAGEVVLFESWLRHCVAPNAAQEDRVSVSFNFHWRMGEPGSG